MPTKEGHYWMRSMNGGDATVVHVKNVDGDWMVVLGSVQMDVSFFKRNTEWAGPIPEPEEDK